MWISSLFQIGIRKLFILGLVTSLAACGGGGGGGKTASPAPASASPISSSNSSSVSTSISSFNISITGSSISSLSSSFSSSTSGIAADTTPDAFSFTAVTGAALSASITSTAITISGINTAAPISITGGQYSINGGTATSAAGTITNGQSVVVSLTTSAILNTTTQAVLTVGGVAQTFAVTTELPDTTPNVFSFTAVTGAPLNLTVTSQAITISGINTAVPISIANGEYSIDGGVFTSAASIVNKGQAVVLKLMSAATVQTETQAVITIGGTATSFSVTTTNVIGGAIQGTPLNIAGVVTTFAGIQPGSDGTGIAARFQAPDGITTDGTHLYVADTYNNKIRKIVIATGVVTTLAGSGSEGGADGTGATASFYHPRGITIAGTYLYVADSDNNKIRKIEIATGVVTTLAGSDSYGSADGIGAAATFKFPSDITTHGDYLYVADSDNNKIRKIEIATGVVTTFAGSGSLGSADGAGAAASFNSPEGIADDDTYLYVADTANHKIRTIEIATGVVTTLAGNGSSGSVDGTGVAASFFNPQGITVVGTHLYIADYLNNRIRQIEIATGVVTTFVGGGSEGSADGIGAAASFSYPLGITTDGTHLYVADTGNYKIRKIAIATIAVTTLAGGNWTGSADGAAATAGFYNPHGITTDGTHLYIADTYNNKIRTIEIATGIVATFAGGSYGSADGIGTAASFNEPTGITTDGTHLYVADTGNSKIRKIEIATGVVTTLAGSGSLGGADGTGTAVSFNYPAGITTDGIYLYVADTGNHKIRKIEIATGVVTTLAGGLHGSADGTGVAARFEQPHGITTDGTYLYVADTDNHKIRKIEIATGIVTTLAGSGLQGGDDGTGAAAGFYFPYGITTDGTYLYVADTVNHKIRTIEIATGVVTTLAGSGSFGSLDGVGTAAKFFSPIAITNDGFTLFVSDMNNNTIRKIE